MVVLVFKKHRNIYDIVICDTNLPNLDGFEVLKALQTIPATVIIPFIFITNQNAKSEFRRAMLIGADFSSSPISLYPSYDDATPE